jgi:ABC-type phosphate/phosphonate transport system substrate-binding protein
MRGFGTFLLCVVLWTTLCQAEQPVIPFIGVSLSDETTAADTKLITLLGSQMNVRFNTKEEESYGLAIRTLADWKQSNGPYLARMTPYAYVAAELLGAKFEVLATYRSRATGASTYHSYFVVNRKDFSDHKNPKLGDLLDFVNGRPSPVKFVFHDKFSTSSYFLPARFFHNERLFSGVKINAAKLDHMTSSGLVNEIAQNPGEIAAVWDGAKQDYETSAGNNSGVYFIQLETDLPNDLLVCSSWMKKEDKETISEAIKSGLRIDVGDFDAWEDINSAPEAKQALGELLRLASEHASPVTVRLMPNGEVPEEAMEAVRQGVRLSGTEFVLHDDFYAADPHAHIDSTWTVKVIHDGAILLRTQMEDAKLDFQEFQISFLDQFDLTKRVIGLIHGRMDRIRYVWPYDDEHPMILRDVDFSIPKGSIIRVQKIAWTDPARNRFTLGEDYSFEVVEADPFKFRIKPPDTAGQLILDPMSNIAYRAILERPSIEEPILLKLTIGLVGLFLLAAVAAGIDLRRRGTMVPNIKSTAEYLEERSRLVVSNYHNPWRLRSLVDKDVLWCDRKGLEEAVQELKVHEKQVPFDVVVTSTTKRSFFVKLSGWKESVGVGYNKDRSEVLSADPSKVGDVNRLSDILAFLVKANRLSPFIGVIPDFDVLDHAVGDFLGFELPEQPRDRDRLLVFTNEAIASYVANHFFNKVLPEADRKLSFFCHSWSVTEISESYLLSHTLQLSAPLRVEGKNIAEIRMECRISKSNGEGILDAISNGVLQAWLFGKLKTRNILVRDTTPHLVCRFNPLALVANSQ